MLSVQWYDRSSAPHEEGRDRLDLIFLECFEPCRAARTGGAGIIIAPQKIFSFRARPNSILQKAYIRGRGVLDSYHGAPLKAGELISKTFTRRDLWKTSTRV